MKRNLTCIICPRGCSLEVTVENGKPLSYQFGAPTHVQAVHLVFDSDLNRETLPGGWCEQGHSTRAQHLLNSPIMHMPTTLCRAFRLIGRRDGQEFLLAHVTDNRKRAHHLPVRRELDSLTLIPDEGWGGEHIPVISFDFE